MTSFKRAEHNNLHVHIVHLHGILPAALTSRPVLIKVKRNKRGYTHTNCARSVYTTGWTSPPFTAAAPRESQSQRRSERNNQLAALAYFTCYATKSCHHRAYTLLYRRIILYIHKTKGEKGVGCSREGAFTFIARIALLNGPFHDCCSSEKNTNVCNGCLNIIVVRGVELRWYFQIINF